MTAPYVAKRADADTVPAVDWAELANRRVTAAADLESAPDQCSGGPAEQLVVGLMDAPLSSTHVAYSQDHLSAAPVGWP
ncbi:hypothetical protein ABNF97_00940 [Plantactinospora sp. B6F1]|uniref:hypothetical protein n=1 Tax=Plantactinospora sp. B6F1 TaxID=3158971 RepID=UPI001A926062